MKLNKVAGFVFKTGRNILNGFESLNDISKNMTIKSIEGDEGQIDFTTPLSISDVKKLFELEIDTKYFNPVYLQEKLGLEIKDENFIGAIKTSKESFQKFTQLLEDIKSQVIDNTIVLPENIDSDNMVVKLAVDQIQDMIEKKAEKLPVVGLVSSLNEYKEQLENTIEISQKTVDILKGNSLFDKNILDVKDEVRDSVIRKKEELILKSQHLLKDMTSLTEGLNDILNIIDKGNSYDNMFSKNTEVESQLNITR